MVKYLFWHYSGGLKSFFSTWINYLEFFWHFFSVGLLARTLFAPWRRDVVRRGPGFDPKEFLEVFIVNLSTRLIGLFIRGFTIILGLLVELAATGLGFLLLFIWLVAPLAIIILCLAGLAVFAASPTSGLLDLILAALFICLLWLFYSLSQEKNIHQLTLEEMMRQAWFKIVWQRAHIRPDELKYLKLDQLSNLLKQHHLTDSEFKEIILWAVDQLDKKEREKRFWLRENLLAIRGLGKDWAYGYTVNLDKFSQDLSTAQPGLLEPTLIGREREVEILERLLVKARENNVLIVGEPGTGRKTIVRGFASAVASGRVLPPLKHKRVLELDISAILASARTASEIEAQLKMILSEATTAGNIILVIDEIQNFVGGQAGPRSLGTIDISNLLIPYLKSKNIQLIGISSYGGYRKHIETNTAFLRFFEKMEILESNEKASLLTLQDMAPRFEARSQVLITYQALREIVTKALQYANEIPMPERAIKLLDETFTYVVNQTGDRTITKEHVDLILSEKTKIPIGQISQDEMEKLAKLEDILHLRVINQEEAIKEIAAAMRRARLGVGETKKPIGSFLFLGPTGVGKTETAKALAEAYFGQESNMVRLDMSEYQNPNDTGRLIGTNDEQVGQLTSQIKEKPFSLLLLDEIEKAHSNILNLFLQVLDEGWLTDILGRRINFRNNIIIATSNAGTELIRQMVGQKIDPALEKEKIMNYLQEKSLFRPEFLNRFDAVIVFHPLSQDNLTKIAILLLNNLAKRLANQNIKFIVTQPLAEKIAEIGYDPEYGARPMKRAIQNRVENLIAQKILGGTLKEGDTIEIKPEDL